MKNILTITAILLSSFVFSQPAGGAQPLMELCPQKTILPLRTYTDIPEEQCYYLKDTNNELQDYEGTWKGIWNNKTIFITFKKLTDRYSIYRKHNRDLLIAKFKVLDNNGNVLFDNTSDSDDNAKIKGSGFANIGSKSGPNNDIGGKYTLLYYDTTLCNLKGTIYIGFVNTTKNQLKFKFTQRRQTIFQSCYYYNYPSSQYPKPLPDEDIILTKQ